MDLKGEGNGPLAAFVHAFASGGLSRFEINAYSEHALGSGEEAAAIAYIQIKDSAGAIRWGAGVDTNIELASIKAVLSALNRGSVG
jgi:2-isopropylmalate synthase